MSDALAVRVVALARDDFALSRGRVTIIMSRTEAAGAAVDLLEALDATSLEIVDASEVQG